MNVAPPRGFTLIKQAAHIKEGDMVLSSHRPGDWRGPVSGTNTMIGKSSIELMDDYGCHIKVARKQL